MSRSKVTKRAMRLAARVAADFIQYVKLDSHLCVIGSPCCECKVGQYCEMLPPYQYRPPRESRETTAT